MGSSRRLRSAAGEAAHLRRRIALGEDSFFGWKEIVFADSGWERPGFEELADELAAFANAHGGALFLGMDSDRREVVGIPPERLGEAERWVAECAQRAVDPPLHPSIGRVNARGADGREHTVLAVDVRPSLFLHRSPSGYLHRVGSSNRIMDPELLDRLRQQRSQVGIRRADAEVVAGSTLQDLDPALVDRFRTPRTQDDRPTLLRKLGMAMEDDESTLRPSVAGVLLGAGHPEQWLRHALIQAVAYRGESVAEGDDARGYQLDAADLVGPLDVQVVEACRFVLRNQRAQARKSIGRTDVPQYDLTAVFEAVVNAVAHRDYSMHGSKIRLRMFSDRLELYSPGAIANTMTVETLAYRQASRNEAITSLLAECPVPDVPGLETQRATMMDRRGEGVTLILERSERLSGRRPAYELLDESELRLTIFAASADEARRE